jgi:hypothetical protein
MILNKMQNNNEEEITKEDENTPKMFMLKSWMNFQKQQKKSEELCYQWEDVANKCESLAVTFTYVYIIIIFLWTPIINDTFSLKYTNALQCGNISGNK